MLQSFIERLPMIWLAIIFIGGGFLNLLWYYVVVLRASDVRWDPVRCRSKSPVIDLKKAQRRRVSVPWLGVPLFLGVAALYAAQIVWNTVFAYMVIAFLCFITAPLRKMWGMYVARRVHQRQTGEPLQTKYWHDVAFYYSWGLDMPAKPDDKVWFEDRLAWLNRFQSLWYVLQVWRFWGIFGQAALSLLWPVLAIATPFYHLDNVDEYKYQRPWWRFDPEQKKRDRRTKPASGDIVDGEVVVDQPVNGTVERRTKA